MNATTITTGVVRLSYAHLFEPVAAPGSDKAKYSVSVIIPKTDKATIAKINGAIAAAKEAGKDKWGGKIPANLKTPLRDGDADRPDDPAYAGSYFFNCSSSNPPAVVDRQLVALFDRTEIKSGDYARVNVNFYAFNTNGNRGIAAGLNSVQKWKDGEALGGSAPSVEAAFGDDFEDEEDILG